MKKTPDNEILTTRSKLFLSIEEAVEFCIKYKLIMKNRKCKKCEGDMNLIKDTFCLNMYRFRCMKSGCKCTCDILSGMYIETPNLALNDYLFVLYLWVEKNYGYNIIKNSNISKSSFDRIKRIILSLISKLNKIDDRKIGTNINSVQVDETIIIKGKLVKSPSETKDKIKNATWLVGAVEEGTYNMKLEIVPNRKKETMKSFFEKNINDNVIVKTDGHKSYPFAVKSINGTHIVVNHEIGFKNENGETTNLIENVWSNLKCDIKTRKGIQKLSIPLYVEEFKWRNKNTRVKSIESTKKAFLKLLQLFFAFK